MGRRRWVALGALVVLVVLGAGCSRTATSTGTSVPPEAASTTTAAATTVAPSPSPSTTAPAVTPQGYGTVAVTVTPPGAAGDVCLWLAATEAQRQQGLMGVTSLGAHPGMLFAWEAPVREEFWMYRTLVPLDIAFYGADGAFVSSASMVPCTDNGDGASCPRYDAAGPYRWAVEAAPGSLPTLGLVAGSRITPGGACG